MRQYLLPLLAIAFLTGPNPGQAAPRTKVHLGPFLSENAQSSQESLTWLGKLNPGVVRLADVVAEEWSRTGGKCRDCERLGALHSPKVLVVRNSGRPSERRGYTPSTPPKDLFSYRKSVAEILMAYQPTILVVEDEIDSANGFYDGTRVGVWDSPDDEKDTVSRYVEELEAACEVAKKLGHRCASGALTTQGAALLVWSNLVKTGRSTEACDFAQRALNSHPGRQDGERFCKTKSLDGIPPEERKQLHSLKALIDGLKKSRADFQTLIWNGQDPKVMEETVAFLRGAVGKPLFVSELNLSTKVEDVDKWKAFQSSVRTLSLPYAILAFGRSSPGPMIHDGKPTENGKLLESWLKDSNP